MRISLLQISFLQFFKTFLIFGLCIFGANFISLLRFFGYFWPKNRSNEIKVAKNRISQILVIVLKNRINEICSNEIRIRRELPVFAVWDEPRYLGSARIPDRHLMMLV